MSGSDIALVIASLAGLVTAVGTVVLQVLALRGNKRIEDDGAGRSAKIAEVHDLVNSKSDDLLCAVKEAALAKGKAEGLAKGRAKK